MKLAGTRPRVLSWEHRETYSSKPSTLVTSPQGMAPSLAQTPGLSVEQNRGSQLLHLQEAFLPQAWEYESF